jgi:hypothetical protein
VEPPQVLLLVPVLRHPALPLQGLRALAGNLLLTVQPVAVAVETLLLLPDALLLLALRETPLADLLPLLIRAPLLLLEPDPLLLVAEVDLPLLLALPLDLLLLVALLNTLLLDPLALDALLLGALLLLNALLLNALLLGALLLLDALLLDALGLPLLNGLPLLALDLLIHLDRRALLRPFDLLLLPGLPDALLVALSLLGVRRRPHTHEGHCAEDERRHHPLRDGTCHFTPP